MENIKKVKPKMRISLTNTLLAIPIGETVSIHSRIAKPESVRKIICKLRKKNYEFEYTEKGRVVDCLVTRIK